MLLMIVSAISASYTMSSYARIIPDINFRLGLGVIEVDIAISDVASVLFRKR